MGVIVLTASVCVSVCVSVRPSHSPGRTDGHTGLNFGMEVKWEDIKVKLVGQGHRSKVKVMRSKNDQWDVPFTFESLVTCLWTCQRRN